MRNDYSDTTVILPTFNERDNIGIMVSALAKRYHNIRVIVSDDGSNDGTREKVAELRMKNSRVSLLDRGKMKVHGLTASVVDAAEATKTRNIIVMDADMQHPIEKIYQIHKELQTQDLIVGARTAVRDWGLLRRIISKGMAYISYFVLKIKGKPTCNDMMSGFFGIRTQLFKGIVKKNKERFVLKGYKVMLDILRLSENNIKIAHVYYSTFHNREHGKSKFGFKHIIYALMSTFK